MNVRITRDFTSVPDLLEFLEDPSIEILFGAEPHIDIPRWLSHDAEKPSTTYRSIITYDGENALIDWRGYYECVLYSELEPLENEMERDEQLMEQEAREGYAEDRAKERHYANKYGD